MFESLLKVFKSYQALLKFKVLATDSPELKLCLTVVHNQMVFYSFIVFISFLEKKRTAQRTVFVKNLACQVRAFVIFINACVEANVMLFEIFSLNRLDETNVA